MNNYSKNEDNMDNYFKYKYAVMRYVPDFATDEFLNAGILVFDADNKIVMTKLTDDSSRFECFDPGGDHDFFMKIASDVLRDIKSRIDKIKQSQDLLMQDTIEKTVKMLVKPKSGMNLFSEVKGGLTLDINKELDKLYDVYIGSKIIKKQRRKEVLPRDYAIQQVYKMIGKIKKRLKTVPVSKSFDYPLSDKGYTCEVSFNGNNNINLKVLSLRIVKKHTYEMQNIFGAITVLSDLGNNIKANLLADCSIFHQNIVRRPRRI